MNIVKYNPWLDRPSTSWLSNFFDEGKFSPLFDNGEMATKEKFVPAIDISETEDEIRLEAELPGMNKEDISVEMKDGWLTLKGERKHSEEHKEGNYYRMERRFGSFQRSFSVPDTVNVEKIKADYKNGVLLVTLPKVEKAKPKQIKVSVH